MTVVVNGQERPVNLVGVTEGFNRIRNLAILRGRYFDSDDMESRSKVCLLTEDLARRMFPFDDPEGREIRVGELQFTVIGVFKERVATFGQTEIKQESVIVPFSLLQVLHGDAVFQDVVRPRRTAPRIFRSSRAKCRRFFRAATAAAHSIASRIPPGFSRRRDRLPSR